MEEECPPLPPLDSLGPQLPMSLDPQMKLCGFIGADRKRSVQKTEERRSEKRREEQKKKKEGKERMDMRRQGDGDEHDKSSEPEPSRMKML